MCMYMMVIVTKFFLDRFSQRFDTKTFDVGFACLIRTGCILIGE